MIFRRWRSCENIIRLWSSERIKKTVFIKLDKNMIGRAIDSVKAVADTAMVGQHKVMVECLTNSASLEKANSELCHWVGQLFNPDGASCLLA